MKKEKEEREKKQKALQKAAEEKAAKAPQVCYIQMLHCYLLQIITDNSAIFVEGRRDSTLFAAKLDRKNCFLPPTFHRSSSVTHELAKLWHFILLLGTVFYRIHMVPDDQGLIDSDRPPMKSKKSLNLP